jgi:uncharacterized membrane protein YfcA
VGRNLVVGFFLGAAGFTAHLVGSEVEWAVPAVSVAGAIPGAWLRATGRLDEAALRGLIGVALLVVAGAIAVTAIVG